MVPMSWVVLGSAVSGQTVMQSMHCVQFSSIKIGISRRATYLLALAPEPAAMTPTAAKGVEG